MLRKVRRNLVFVLFVQRFEGEVIEIFVKLVLIILKEERKGGRKEERKEDEGRKEDKGRKEGRKEGR